MISDHLEYLKDHPDVPILDFAYTLQDRRSTLPYRKDIFAPTVKDAIVALEALGATDAETEGMNTRFKKPQRIHKAVGDIHWPRRTMTANGSSPH